MANFDSSALSAVADFFGGESSQGTNDEPIKPIDQRKRSGVGVVETRKVPSLDLTSKKLLRVGKRKRAEDNEGDDTGDVYSSGRESDDDDEGRTAIEDKPVNTVIPETDGVTNEKTKKKKKKGKKERQKETKGVSAGDKTTEAEATVKESVEEPTAEDFGANPPKRKRRRKVRSRQKNIYKDKRKENEKPDHLRLGNKLYNGRPMTRETRSKLDIPEPKPKEHIRYEELETVQTTETTKLAIDDLLADQGDGFAKGQDTKIKKKRKMSKKKKSKYKNL